MERAAYPARARRTARDGPNPPGDPDGDGGVVSCPTAAHPAVDRARNPRAADRNFRTLVSCATPAGFAASRDRSVAVGTEHRNRKIARTARESEFCAARRNEYPCVAS